MPSELSHSATALPKAVDVGTYYTNDLIEEINKFDESAIIKQAREFKR